MQRMVEIAIIKDMIAVTREKNPAAPRLAAKNLPHITNPLASAKSAIHQIA